MFKIFPWQTSIWTFLFERYQKERLAHAFLFEGAQGIGKAGFARAFAELLLCQKTELDHACGHCRSCKLLKTSIHPDLICITAEGKTIKVDQIRELNASIIKTAHFPGYRVVMIEAAHQMNQAASNALLKTLEEPPSQVIFILLTDSVYQISATIRSRCEKINFPKPCFDQVKIWLETHFPVQSTQQYTSKFLFELVQERPLAALALIDNDDLIWREKLMADISAVVLKAVNPLDFAEKYQPLPLDKLCFWLKTIIIDLIRLKAKVPIRLINSDQLNQLQEIAATLDAMRLYTYLDKVYAVSCQVARGMNLNAALVVDEIFCGILDSKVT